MRQRVRSSAWTRFLQLSIKSPKARPALPSSVSPRREPKSCKSTKALLPWMPASSLRPRLSSTTKFHVTALCALGQKKLGHTDAASLLQETLDEEEATDQALTEIAKTAVNQEAEAA